MGSPRRPFPGLVVLLCLSCHVLSAHGCKPLFPASADTVVVNASECYTLTNGAASGTSGLVGRSSIVQGAGITLNLQLENALALSVGAPWSLSFTNVSFLGTVFPPSATNPSAIFLPTAFDLSSGGSVAFEACNITTSCASFTRWASWANFLQTGAPKSWRVSQRSSTSYFISSATTSQVNLTSVFLSCSNTTPNLNVSATVASATDLASMLRLLNTVDANTTFVTLTNDVSLMAWQPASYSSNLVITSQGPGSSPQPVFDMESSPDVFNLAQPAMLSLSNVALKYGCVQFNATWPSAQRMPPLVSTMGAVFSATSNGRLQPLQYQGVLLSNASIIASADEIRTLMYRAAVYAASPLFSSLPSLAPLMQQLPVQAISLAASPSGTLLLSSMQIPGVSYTNVTLRPGSATPQPDSATYQQCGAAAPIMAARSIDWFTISFLPATTTLPLSLSLDTITSTTGVTVSNFPWVVLISASMQLYTSSSQLQYMTQRDILLTGPLEPAPARNGGSPSNVTLDLSGAIGSMTATNAARIFLQRLVLTNLSISQLSASGEVAIQRSALPVWAFQDPGIIYPYAVVQLYMCTMYLIPADFVQLYNIAIRGADWKVASSTNVLVQNTDTFSVQFFDSCNILFAQYSGFGLNATNLLVLPTNCDTAKQYIAGGSGGLSPPGSSPSADGSGGGARISTGATIGIAVGVSCGAVLALAAGFAVWRARRRSKRAASAAASKEVEISTGEHVGRAEDFGDFGPKKEEDPLSLWRNLYEGGLREDSNPRSVSIEHRTATTPLASGERDVEAGTAPRSRGPRSGGDGAAAAAAAALAAPEALPSSWDPHKEVASLASNLADETNKLVLLEPIGQGGFGTVYRGRWRNLEVAVKTVLFSEASKSGSDAKAANKRQSAHPQQRAILEAAVCTSVMHPNLVTTYHYDITPVNGGGAETRGISGMTIDQGRNTDWKLYLVQEYCNASLQDALRNKLLHKQDTKAPDMDLVLMVLMDIARGLVYIHAKNIIHGDLTPGNVLLKQDPNSPIGVVGKITDFGLCTTIDPTMTHISNVTNGTPYYVAPEVVTAGTLTKKSDVYSFGVLMWELYRCMPPWVKTETGYTLNKRFRRFPLDTPHVYVSLCARCLDKNPKERPGFEQLLVMLEAMHAAYLMGYDKLTQPRAAQAAAAAPEPAATSGSHEPGAFMRASSCGGGLNEQQATANKQTLPAPAPAPPGQDPSKPGNPPQEPPPRSTALVAYFKSQALSPDAPDDTYGHEEAALGPTTLDR